ncbi:MAG: hypothetical protein WDN03_02510 [Rhizomicrobium sp.]
MTRCWHWDGSIRRAPCCSTTARGNLVPARALGMKTVWLNDGLGQSHWRIDDPERHIDHQTDDLAAFLHSIRI